MKMAQYRIAFKLTTTPIETIKTLLPMVETWQRIFYLQYLDLQGVFFTATIQDKVDLQQVCSVISSNASFIQIEVDFEHDANGLALLESKGFSHYDDMPYVDFIQKERNVKVALYQEETYRLVITRLDEHPKADTAYFLRLLNRVTEIMQGG